MVPMPCWLSTYEEHGCSHLSCQQVDPWIFGIDRSSDLSLWSTDTCSWVSFWRVAYLFHMEQFALSFYKPRWAVAPECWGHSSVPTWRPWTFGIHWATPHKPHGRWPQNQLSSSWAHALYHWAEIHRRPHSPSWRVWSSSWGRQGYLYPRSTKDCCRSCVPPGCAWDIAWGLTLPSLHYKLKIKLVFDPITCSQGFSIWNL